MFLLVKPQHFDILKIIWTKDSFVGVLYVGSSVICFISYVITSKLFTYQEINHIFQEYSINLQGGDTTTTNNLGFQFFLYLIACAMLTYYFPFITCGLKQRFKNTTQAALPRTPPFVTLRMFPESLFASYCTSFGREDIVLLS